MRGASCAAQPAADGRGRQTGVTPERSVPGAERATDERLRERRDDIAAVGQQEAGQQRVRAFAAPAATAAHPRRRSAAPGAAAHHPRVGRPRRQRPFAAWAARIVGQRRPYAPSEQRGDLLAVDSDHEHRSSSVAATASAYNARVTVKLATQRPKQHREHADSVAAPATDGKRQSVLRPGRAPAPRSSTGRGMVSSCQAGPLRPRARARKAVQNPSGFEEHGYDYDILNLDDAERTLTSSNEVAPKHEPRRAPSREPPPGPSPGPPRRSSIVVSLGPSRVASHQVPHRDLPVEARAPWAACSPPAGHQVPHRDLPVEAPPCGSACSRGRRRHQVPHRDLP